MTLEELRSLRMVQAILVRNYVDTQRVDVDVVGTSVYIEGKFHVFDYHPAHHHPDPFQREMTMKRVLLQIEREIRSFGEVTHLEMKFRNWNRIGPQWVSRDGAAQSSSLSSHSHSSFDLSRRVRSGQAVVSAQEARLCPRRGQRGGVRAEAS